MNLDSDSDSSIDWSTPVAPAVSAAKQAPSSGSSNNRNDSKNNPNNNSTSNNTIKGEAAMLAARRRAFQNQRKGVPTVTASTAQTNTAVHNVKNNTVITQATNSSSVKENSTSSLLQSSRSLHEEQHEPHHEQKSSTLSPSVNTRHKVRRKSSSVSTTNLEINDKGKVNLNDATNKVNVTSSMVTSASVLPAAAAISSNTNTMPQEMSEVEKLRLEIATKRKSLELMRDEEKELENKWRTTRAGKQAELTTLERRLYALRNEMDEMKTSTERAIQHEDDQREIEVHKNRNKLETCIKEEFEPQVKCAQDKLSHLQESERELMSLLKASHGNVTDTDKNNENKGNHDEQDDLVMLAVANAAQAIMTKLEDEFAANDVADKMAWREELREQIAHEVRTSFTVGVESEWESEQKRQRQLMDELDTFVCDVASQQRSRFNALDDAFAAELHLLAEQSTRALEEQSSKVMNRFDQLRERWVAQQETILSAQMKAHMARRENELNEQCRWRDELYQMQLAECHGKHEQATCQNEELHTRTMDALHKFMSQHEQINKEREDAIRHICHAGSEYSHSVESIQEQIESALHSLTEYEDGVDASCQALAANHQSALCTQREMLHAIQSFMTVECDHTDSERRHVNDLANKLHIAEVTLRRCLEEEALNLHEFEARSKETKEEWARCYRQWKELIQRETQCTTDEFDRLLRTLRERSFAMKYDKQIMQEYIHELQQVLQEFHETVHDGVDVLHDQENEVTNKYNLITEQVASVQKESTQIKLELQKVTNEKEESNKKQREVDGLKAQLVAEVQSLESLRKELALTRKRHVKDLSFAQELMTRLGASVQARNSKHEYEVRSRAIRTQSRASTNQSNINVNYNARLPVKVLREMQDELARSVTHQEQSFHVNKYNSGQNDKYNYLQSRQHHNNEQTLEWEEQQKQQKQQVINKRKSNQQQEQENLQKQKQELQKLLLPPHSRLSPAPTPSSWSASSSLPPASHVITEGKDNIKWTKGEHSEKYMNKKYAEYSDNRDYKVDVTTNNHDNNADRIKQINTMHNNYVSKRNNVTSPSTCFEPTTLESASRSPELKVCQENGTYKYIADTKNKHNCDNYSPGSSNTYFHQQQQELQEKESSKMADNTRQVTRNDFLHDGVVDYNQENDNNILHEQSEEVDQSISNNESLLPVGQKIMCENADETLSTTANTFTNLLALSDADTLLLTPEMS